MSDEERMKMMKSRAIEAGNRMAATYDQVGPRFFAYLGRRLVELAEIPVGTTVLDVACGRGAVLFPAAERVGPQGRVIGIDVVDGMVTETNAEIQRRGLTNTEARVMNAEALNFPDDSFDVVTCGFAIFFFPTVAETLAGFRRVLKPGGMLAVSTWGRDDERWKWMGELYDAYRQPTMPWTAPTVNRFNNEPGLREIMSEAEFEQVRVIGEDPEFAYADEETWLAVQWSHGNRFRLEMMPPDVLEKFKAEAFEKIQVNQGPNGFHHLLPTLFTLAMKPKTV